MTKEKLVSVNEEKSNEETVHLMIEMDYLGQDLNSFLETGIVIARLELEGKHICLETNGEKGDMYLELVEYDVNDEGDYVESSFTEPIYTMPKTTEEVDELFEDWFEVDELFNDESFTGGKELYDAKKGLYTYWSFENGKAIKPLSPSFKKREDFTDWMEKHYQ